jgi:hypothetical protein
MKADHERIGLVLLGLKQGAAGLLQRIQPYLNLAEGGVFDLTQVRWMICWSILCCVDAVFDSFLGGRGPQSVDRYSGCINECRTCE